MRSPLASEESWHGCARTVLGEAAQMPSMVESQRPVYLV